MPILPALTLLHSYPDDLVVSVMLACCSLGADPTCDFIYSNGILATGTTRLVLNEPISSHIDWLFGLETASFEHLACNFADGLVSRISLSRSPFPKVLTQMGERHT